MTTEQYKRSAREVAFQAVNTSLADKRFIADTIADWRKTEMPSPQEAALALEIASGAIKMARHLDWAALQVTNKQKLQLKRKEKALLRCASYQLLFLDGIASHAAVNESVKLAKRYCHPTFARFLNAVCRRLTQEKPVPPQEDLALYFSYPDFFVDSLLQKYDRDQVQKILQSGNTSPATWVRRRNLTLPLPEGVVSIEGAPKNAAKIVKRASLIPLFDDPNYYIQNVTQIAVLDALLDRLPTPPKRILDLCASPGGKTLLLADRYPEAELHANDLSRRKLDRIKENLEMYGVNATLHCGEGEHFQSEEPFDLVVIDAPCSNSGTFARRAEARWRFEENTIKELNKVQHALIKNAKKQLSKTGHLIYVSCSIFSEENDVVAQDKPIVGKPILHFPNDLGWDGGFGCLMKNS